MTHCLPKRKHMLMLELETLVSATAAAYKVLLLPCPLPELSNTLHKAV